MIEGKYIYNFLFMRNFRLFLFSYTTRTSMVKYFQAEKSGKITLEELAGIDKNVSNIINETKTSLKTIKNTPNVAD